VSVTTNDKATAADDTTISAVGFEYLRDLLRQRSGIELDENHQYLVDSRLSPVARQHSLDDVEALLSRLRLGIDEELRVDVIDAMTTNETSFFRDQHPFSDLTHELFPKLLANKSADDRLNIWCAASSSGQEPYTLAIVLSESFANDVALDRIRILATDLSSAMVKRVGEGRYSHFEVNRGLSTELRDKYFVQDGRDWVARDELRHMVDVAAVNLLESWSPVPRCDLVLLRNVLIYFSVETRREILRRIRTDVLRPGGFMMLGSSENLLGIDDIFERISTGGGSCYQVPLDTAGQG